MDVIGLGALNYDKLYVVERTAKAGEEVGVIDVRGYPGGSAANTIVGLARLGVSTGFIGIVGDDIEGKIIMDDFAAEGIDVSRIRRVRGSSGTALGLVDKHGERVLYIHPGVNDALSMDDEDINYANNAHFVHMSSFVDRGQLEMQVSLVERIKTKVSFNPGMLCFKFSLEDLQPIIEKSDVIFLNDDEMDALTSCDYESGSKALLELGTKTVATTLGEKGCYVADDKGARLIAPCKTKVVDTTGAGDAFAAGFLYALLGEKSIYECGRLGNFFAARCISEYGARKGLPYKRDLEGFRSVNLNQ
ncbi:MAG: carbohydrate kinase family protein [Methanocellales archaeon]|nr:carbohydrate kinase family protein [Methanocellales archaeon]